MLHSPPTYVYRAQHSYHGTAPAEGLVPSRDVSPSQFETPVRSLYSNRDGHQLTANDRGHGPQPSVIRTSPSEDSVTNSSPSTTATSSSDASSQQPHDLHQHHDHHVAEEVPLVKEMDGALPCPPPRLQPGVSSRQYSANQGTGTADVLEAQEKKIAALTALVASQQEQISELLAFVRSSSSSSSSLAAKPAAATTHSQGRAAGGGGSCAAEGSRALRSHGSSAVGTLPSHTPQSGGTAWRDEVETMCLDAISSRLQLLDEKIAMSVAERIRRVTREHVLSSVDKTIRRALRDATLDRSHPLATLLTDFKTLSLETKYRQVYEATATVAAGAADDLHKKPPPREIPSITPRESTSESDEEEEGEESQSSESLHASVVLGDIAARARLVHRQSDTANSAQPPYSSLAARLASSASAGPKKLLETAAPLLVNTSSDNLARRADRKDDDEQLGGSSRSSHSKLVKTTNRVEDCRSVAATTTTHREIHESHKQKTLLRSADVESSITRLKQLVHSLELAEE